MIYDLFNSFSHEINNSLQSIQFQQEILEMKAKELENKDIEKISNKINNGLLKINDILIPVYNNNKVSKSIKLDSIVQESLSFLEVFLKTNKVNLNISKEYSNDFEVITSKGGISQLIVHLIKELSKNNKDLLMTIDFEKISIMKLNLDSLNFDLINFMATQNNLELIVNKDNIEIKFSLKNKLKIVA